MPNILDRDETVRLGNVVRRQLLRTDSGEVSSVTAVVAADDDREIKPLAAQ